MKLVLDCVGSIDTISITSLPRSFVTSVFKHCLGKNNTPYFANNCFKGVLYFDTAFAARLAAKSGFTWTDWTGLTPFYSAAGVVHETNLRLTVQPGGAGERMLGVTQLRRSFTKVDFSRAVPAVPEGEVVVLLGSVDKGQIVFTLEDAPEPFEPDKLELLFESFEDFDFEDLVLSGALYAGAPMTRDFGKRRGKNMIDPLLFSGPGRELDLHDFTAEYRVQP